MSETLEYIFAINDSSWENGAFDSSLDDYSAGNCIQSLYWYRINAGTFMETRFRR